METTDSNRRAVRLTAGIGVVIVAIGLFFWLRVPPQMGTSDEAFHTVDALYTAVRNRDETQLAQCEQRLKSLADAGSLPADAASSLDRIVARARSGSWHSAAERLYEFMLAQRRDGYTGSPKPTPATRRKK